jgi:hypothetical protein
MVQTKPISDLSLAEVEQKFGLKQTDSEDFFPEWFQDLPEISDEERRALDQIKSSFLYLSKYPMSEEAVKLVVVSPLLSMAGFYQPPFRMKTEAAVQITREEAGETLRGRIDVLILQEQFWVLVVESKEAGFSLQDAIAQAVGYMATTAQQPTFGLATNGSEFLFLKLITQPPQYGLSDLMTLHRRKNDLYNILAVLKRINQIVPKDSST